MLFSFKYHTSSYLYSFTSSEPYLCFSISIVLHLPLYISPLSASINISNSGLHPIKASILGLSFLSSIPPLNAFSTAESILLLPAPFAPIILIN